MVCIRLKCLQTHDTNTHTRARTDPATTQWMNEPKKPKLNGIERTPHTIIMLVVASSVWLAVLAAITPLWCWEPVIRSTCVCVFAPLKWPTADTNTNRRSRIKYPVLSAHCEYAVSKFVHPNSSRRKAFYFRCNENEITIVDRHSTFLDRWKRWRIEITASKSVWLIHMAATSDNAVSTNLFRQITINIHFSWIEFNWSRFVRCLWVAKWRLRV